MISKNKKIIASVIIPVCNAEKTLSYCLESILNQTYQNFEVILINDGSKDNSQKIIEKYKSKYPRKFRIYTQKNHGVSITRNNGIKYASGDYLFFIDNDDYIEKDYIKTFVTAIKEQSVDMVIGGYERIDFENKKVIFKRDTIDDISTKYIQLAPWGRVYRKEALIKNNLKFLDMNIGEDIYINILANLKLKVKIINYNGYRWVFNKLSVSNTKQKGLKRVVNFLPLLIKIHEDTRNMQISQTESTLLEYFFIKTCIFYLLHSGRGVEYERLKDANKKTFKWLKSIYPTYYKNPNISLFNPKGESFSTRAIVYLFILLQKLHLENIFLRMYSKI